jgi:hypothetical protein
MKAAIFIRDLYDGPFNGGRKHQALYRLMEPMTYPVFDEDCLEREEVVWHVMVSAVDWCRFHETYIYPADESGSAVLTQLEGSERGIFDHERALSNAGYTIVRSAHELAALYAGRSA